MSKRQYEWIGGAKLLTPETDAGTTISEVEQLIPPRPQADVAGNRDRFLIEAIYLHFSIRRAGTNALSAPDALGFLVWQESVQEGQNLPIQSLDALSLGSRLYSNKRIMMMAPLPVPPLLGSSDLLTFIASDEVKTSHHEYQATRKHDRGSQVLCLNVNCDISLVFRVFAQWRVLVSYGQ